MESSLPINLNTENLYLSFSSLDKIQDKDIKKIYIRESKEPHGVHYKIASTDHPIWMCVKHFFISLFSFFKYNYASGQNALKKINDNPDLLKTLNEKMTKTAQPLLPEKPVETSTTIKTPSKVEAKQIVDRATIRGLCAFGGAILAGNYFKGEPFAVTQLMIRVAQVGGAVFGATLGGLAGFAVYAEEKNAVKGVTLSIFCGGLGAFTGYVGADLYIGETLRSLVPLAGFIAGFVIAEIGMDALSSRRSAFRPVEA